MKTPRILLRLRLPLLLLAAWSIAPLCAQETPSSQASPATVAAPAPTEGTEYFFVQIADPQFGSFTGDPNRFEQETLNFEFVIETINRLRPAFVVVCGDLVHHEGDPGQIAEYKRIIGLIDPSIPLYSASGNHDIGNNPTPESLALYRASIGPDRYSFRHADLVGIVLNSTIMMEPALVEDEEAAQRVWLRNELEGARASGARSIMVFQHHPFFIGSVGETNANSVPLRTRDAYLSLFREFDVRFAFAGHLHRNAEAAEGDFNMISTSAVGPPLGNDGSGIRVVIVRPTGVSHTFYHLGNLPTAVSLEAGRGRGRGGAGGRGGFPGRGAGTGGGPQRGADGQAAPARGGGQF
jgi:3',5'-cyclic AMP phosphodiesterase CpdA